MSVSTTRKFISAVPVWEKGRSEEMNVSLIFRGKLPRTDDAHIHIAASSRYQIFVNGEFFAAGPARAAHGFYRVGDFDLAPKLAANENTVAIIVAGYNSNSFYLLDEPSFLCAEIVADGGIKYATGCKDFEATRFNGRLQRVMRYSFQRPFTECCVLNAWYDGFMNGSDDRYKPITLEKCGEKKFITQTTPYPEHTEEKAKHIISKGILIPLKSDKVRKYDDRSFSDIGERLKGFTPDMLDANPIDELYAYAPTVTENEKTPAGSTELGTNSFAVYDMGENTTGYIRLSVTAQHDAVLYAVFGERLNENGVTEPASDGCSNVVQWSVQGGRSYDLVSFEPYTFKYISVVSMYAPTLVTNVSLYAEKFPDALITHRPVSNDKKLQKIYNAAVSTFRQCATDIFMDCPSRERAGWLCDSFFTARTEKYLTGKTDVEDAFLENFVLPDSFSRIPDGMLPMCYPADHYDGAFIPNWAMWFAIELNDRMSRTEDMSIAEKAKPKLYSLAKYFEKLENSDGLLENLKGWVFVEWSKANSFVNGVNYPSNMLYSMFLDAVANLYGDGSFAEKAEKVRTTVCKNSFDGEFFHDNAVREDGILKLTDNISETCQYYAFFSKTASKDKYPELWAKLLNGFGPGRDCEKVYPNVCASNVFIGCYLRLQLLLNDKRYDKVRKEAADMFLPMAEQTGTLWEHLQGGASRCHGFASYAAVLLSEAEKNTASEK